MLAEREDVAPATDRRPGCWLIGALVFLANREWQAGSDRSPDAMSAAFDACAGEQGGTGGNPPRESLFTREFTLKC